jgi:hypothetical protein
MAVDLMREGEIHTPSWQQTLQRLRLLQEGMVRA